ncbi:hypothetical protein J3R82DRAFT_11050 [Butyriboletus roseoflavus]|nr:hypothetical protein J3R82DRAFT_11050 [Butyriboletus roseoflavus]
MLHSVCGKIKYCRPGYPAVVIFETHSAANTALMLNGGKLSRNTYTVTSKVEYTDHHDAEEHHFHIEQSDKPRAGIAAEYLAKGYELSDGTLQRAIEIDIGQSALGPDQTVSGKVQSTSKEVHTRAKSTLKQKGYSEIPHGYYANALASPLGQSVLSFYISTTKEVRDIHQEAIRIKKYMATPIPTSPPASAPVSPATTQPEPSK